MLMKLSFKENAGGAASVIGQFVSSEDTGTSGAFANKLGIHKESRQVTLENSKYYLLCIVYSTKRDFHELLT